MFRLEKWYLDCVTETGDVAIFYRASLVWGPIRLAYGASLHAPHPGEPIQRQTFRPGTTPTVNNGVVEWSCQKLDVSGIWSSRMDGIEKTLADEPDGSIHWNCICPSANVRIHLDGVSVEGLGYVEHLTMTLKPWQLPFVELRWGRFLSQDDSLAWIQWDATAHKTWVWLNGIERQGVNLTNDKVELVNDGLVLELRDNIVLRSGSLNSTAMRPVRAITALVPGWRTAQETKWLASGTLRGQATTNCGWAIHEVVRWP